MAMSPDRKRVIRIAGLVVSVAGAAAMTAALVRFILAVARNEVDEAPLLTGLREYYRQIGAHYARGFNTGFFLCYFLMLFAVIAGTWVDEILRARRAARATPPPD